MRRRWERAGSRWEAGESPGEAGHGWKKSPAQDPRIESPVQCWCGRGNVVGMHAPKFKCFHPGTLARSIHEFKKSPALHALKRRLKEQAVRA